MRPTLQGRVSKSSGRTCLPALTSVPVRAAIGDYMVTVMAQAFGNNVCWFDPTRGITTATGISTWADSGAAADGTASAKDITQGTGSAQPTLVADAYNYTPTSRYVAASSQNLRRTSTNLFAAGAYTLCVVTQTTSNNQGVFDCASLNAGCGYINNGIFRTDVHYGVATFDAGAAASVLETFVLTRAAASKPKMFLNGAEQALGGAATNLIDPGGTAAITMGARGDTGSPANFLTGDVSEVIGYTGEAPAYVRRRLDAYLCARYARDFTLWT